MTQTEANARRAKAKEAAALFITRYWLVRFETAKLLQDLANERRAERVKVLESRPLTMLYNPATKETTVHTEYRREQMVPRSKYLPGCGAR